MDVQTLEDILNHCRFMNGDGDSIPEHGRVSVGEGRVNVLDESGSIIGYFVRDEDNPWWFEPA